MDAAALQGLTRRVFYAGPPGVGRATSLISLLPLKGQIMAGDRDYPLRWPSSSRDVVLSYSSLATKFYYRAEDPGRPAHLQPYLQRLVGIDGVVFVADSQFLRREHNSISLNRLRADLRLVGMDLNEIAVIFQLNKRDLPDLLTRDELVTDLKTARCGYVG